nr:efflux RND transporter periplasmic adaptor subunit [Parabacteroides sp. Marseille-P3160]
MNYPMKTATIIACALVSCAVCSCSSSKEKGGKEENVSTVLPDEPNRVKAKRLVYSDFHHELISNGTLSALQRAELKFESTETIAAVYVKNGTHVAKGQKIAALDEFKLKNTLAQAKDNLEKARLELQDVLISQGYSLKDSARVPAEVMNIAKIRSNYNSSLAQYELASYQLEKAVLYAPFEGIVANLSSKAYNPASTTDAFCTVMGGNQVEVNFKILENELPLINNGDKVSILPYSISDRTIEGRITEINPAVDKTGMVSVKAFLTGGNREKLYDGMNVKVKVQRLIPKQLILPKEALVLRSNKKVVFTAKDGKAIWNYVQTGMENSTDYVVTEGLSEGDSVIYEGNINLAHETPVIVVN